MHVTPSKGEALLERDWAEAFKMVQGNTYLSGFTASYSAASFVFQVEAGKAIINGRIITSTATADLSVTLKANEAKYVYLYLKSGNYGLNATGARLAAFEDEQQFVDAVLLYYVKASSAGISTVTDMRVKSLAYQFAHCGSALVSPYDSVSLSANTERSVTGTTETEVKSFSIEHPGTVTLTCEMKRSLGTGTLKVYTTSGGATAVATITATTNTYASKTLNFTVAPGDTIRLKLVSSSGSYVTYIQNAVLSYRLGIPMAPAILID